MGMMAEDLLRFWCFVLQSLAGLSVKDLTVHRYTRGNAQRIRTCYPKHLCILSSQSQSSSSSSIGAPKFPTELLLPCLAALSSSPKLFRTLSSNPGKLARCFLNGLPTMASGATSEAREDTVFEVAVSAADVDMLSRVRADGPGEPDTGLFEDLRAAGEAAAWRGSAECWRFNYVIVSSV